MEKTCYCGSALPFSDCCEPLINGTRKAETAQQLMRSRYSAYATAAADYIVETTHPSTRKYHSLKTIREWAEETTWIRLEISAFTETTVTFNAYFVNDKGFPEVHSEHSTFRKEDGKWYFLSGE